MTRAEAETDRSFAWATVSRRADYDNYLVSLLQPSPMARHAYITLRAFNVELAQVRDHVTNPLIGNMRMQFWRDTIDDVFKGRPRKTPIAMALSEILRTMPMNKLWFSRIINEREANLDVDQYISVKDMERYCENTSSALLYLHLDTLSVKNTLADHAASHLGKAAGITTLLRGTPYQAKERRVYLPGEVLSKVGCEFPREDDNESLILNAFPFSMEFRKRTFSEQDRKQQDWRTRSLKSPLLLTTTP